MRVNRIIMNVVIAMIMGISICLIVKAFSAYEDLQSNAVFVAELSQNIMPGQRITVESVITDIDMVQSNSVRLISADDALKLMKKDMPELSYMADNPFLDIITFKTKGLQGADIEKFKDEVMQIKGVEGVFFDDMLLTSLPETFANFRWGLITIAGLVLLGAIIILVLRIKRDIRAFSKDIKVMSIAGADEDNIVKTRVTWSTKWGAISASIAAVAILVNIIFINNTLLDGLEITFLQSFLGIAIMFVIVVGVHTFVTFRSLKAYFSSLNLSIAS